MNTSELPLQFDEIKRLVGPLAIDLSKAIRKTNELAEFDPDWYQFETLAKRVDVKRTEGEIIAIVRRYDLECQHCKNSFVLGRWYLKDRGTLLQCPECNQYVPLAQHHDFLRLETVMNFAPVLSIQDLFAQKK